MAIAIVLREAALESAFAPPLASYLRINRAALTITALVASMIPVAELAGQSAPADAALHGLPLHDNRTKSEGMLRDYVRIIESGTTRRHFESVVHGALRVFVRPCDPGWQCDVR